ncbi:phytosulfokine receptor 2 [Momordica charantia]|uniref:non-specific serine/threonine protein kinase n=1 Tax=Momordica charantia TaxID=3673 RepID=A0A6J1CLX9_MOMCH|nr:phytosulfokine receptor 2 [Momordica charantia]
MRFSEVMVLNLVKMTFQTWIILTCLLSFSLGLKPPNQIVCDPKDLLALRGFVKGLTNSSILSVWLNESSCCSWDGVDCGFYGNTSLTDRVTKLVLPNMNLKGKISQSLAGLDQLIWLNLSYNQLEGGLPTEFSSLKQLQVLDLSYNKLSGPVTNATSGLKSVRILNISSNSFAGDFPQLMGFQNIAAFNISNNSFTGEVSSQICNSSNVIQVVDISLNRISGVLQDMENCSKSLKHFRADYNLLTGNLPDSLYSLSSLEYFSIPGNSLFGQLSMELSKLSRLKSFIIFGNKFSGELPNVFGNFSELQELVGHSNLFSGILPSSLSLCSKLRVFDLRNNTLTGTIDLNFSRLPDLQMLDLASNHFSGALPNSLSDCHELKTLSLAKNNLTGQIPRDYSKLSSLTFLSLSNNSIVNLGGALSVLQNCKNLTILILTKNFRNEEIPQTATVFNNLTLLAFGYCGLKGPIPGWLQGCKKLSILDLSWNHLNGSIPPWIGQLENLFYLDLSNNSLTGEIPKSLTRMKALISKNCSSSSSTSSAGIPLFVKRNQSSTGLQYNQASSFPPSIYLSYNRINGTILPEIGRLKWLHVLDLSRNDITGSIPSTISEMENLETLDLSNNDLYGRIPPSFDKLTFLSKFSVANNHLEGPIPNGGQFLSFPTSSFEGNAGLCGEIDDPCHSVNGLGTKPETSTGSKRKIGKSVILCLTVGAAAAVLLLLTVVLLKMSRKDVRDQNNSFDEEFNTRDRLSGALGSSKLVLFQNSECRDLTVSELLKATSNFNQANIIGCGGFGLVYKANLPNGSKAAVKRLTGDCGQMEREFQAEVEALSRAQHKNLVSLQGYCKHGNDRLLIYSYMENGSLDYWLHEIVDNESILKWEARLKIAQGAAHGLAYLHKECQPNIIHRDVKSSNILLDDRFEAHLADFGLSRLLRPYDTHVTTDLVGTLGYIPPEYSQTLTATCRGDVYSFGVVLLELLTGRRPVEVCKGKACRDLVSWVIQKKSEKREEEIVDPAIWDTNSKKQILEVLSITCKCIDQDPRKRPSIEEVSSWLDGVTM